VQPHDLQVLDLEAADRRSSDHQPANRQGADGSGADSRCPGRGRADADRCQKHRRRLLAAVTELHRTVGASSTVHVIVLLLVRLGVAERANDNAPSADRIVSHGRVVSRSASPPPGRTDEPGQLTLSLPVWPGAPCVCWPTRRCCRVGRRPVGANGPNFCGTLGRCRRRPESGDPKRNPWSVWRLGFCGTWHLPAAAVALRCQVARSPDRKPAKPLPTLGGVEPQTAGQRPLSGSGSGCAAAQASIPWVDDRAAGAPTPLAM
jgi:hypothetical protein